MSNILKIKLRYVQSYLWIIFWVSYSKNPLKRTNPPYNAIDIIDAPNAVVGGKNAEAIEDMKTTPNPMAKGPPIYKNLSLGAVIAIVDKPPTTPAVYQAALNTLKNK